jgi:hypothetical protein
VTADGIYKMVKHYLYDVGHRILLAPSAPHATKPLLRYAAPPRPTTVTAHRHPTPPAGGPGRPDLSPLGPPRRPGSSPRRCPITLVPTE